MNVELRKYLQMLGDENNCKKGDMITNIGLLLEKNNSHENPTDYSLLLPAELLNLSLTAKDADEIIDCLLLILKEEPAYSNRIVWSVGKTFDEKKVELLLQTILQTKFCDEETFSQILFLVDVVKNDHINELVHKLEFLRK